MNTSMSNIVKISEETKQFIIDLQQSSVLSVVCQPIDDCVFGAVRGSRQMGLEEESSDFDIVTVTKNNASRQWTGQSLRYYASQDKSIHVHWFPAGVESFFIADDCIINPEGLTFAGLFDWGFITEDFIFFRNPKYSYILDNFLKYKTRLMRLGAYKYSNKYLYNTLSSIKQSFEVVQDWLPTICRLCQISQALIYGNPLENKEALKDIKRGRNLKKHYSYMIEKLEELNKYLQNNPLDIEKETQELINLMYEGGINYATREKENI